MTVLWPVMTESTFAIPVCARASDVPTSTPVPPIDGEFVRGVEHVHGQSAAQRAGRGGARVQAKVEITERHGMSRRRCSQGQERTDERQSAHAALMLPYGAP
jgi:hypothetical protein